MTAQQYKEWADSLIGVKKKFNNIEATIVSYRIADNRLGAWLKLNDGREIYRKCRGQNDPWLYYKSEA